LFAHHCVLLLHHCIELLDQILVASLGNQPEMIHCRAVMAIV